MTDQAEHGMYQNCPDIVGSSSVVWDLLGGRQQAAGSRILSHLIIP